MTKPNGKSSTLPPICFYRKADLGGVCSAAIVKHFVPECEMYGLDYGDEFPWDKIRPTIDAESEATFEDHVGYGIVEYPFRTVYLVDFSLPVENMEQLSKVSNLIWIDHHASVLKEAEERGFMPLGVRETHSAACELAWVYFESYKREVEAAFHPEFQVDTETEIVFPEAVRLLGRYDIGDTNHPDWESRILPFRYGVQALDGVYDPESEWWPLFVDPPPTEWVGLREEPGATFWNPIAETKSPSSAVDKALMYELRVPLSRIHPGLAETWVDGLRVVHAEIVEPAKHLPLEEDSAESFLRLTAIDCRHEVGKVIQHGRFILSHQAQQNKVACAGCAHEAVLTLRDPDKEPWVEEREGGQCVLIMPGPTYRFVDGRIERVPDRVMPSYRLICLNTPNRGSESFDSVYDPGKHDVMCAYVTLSDGRYRVSLYSTKPEIDCGAIARAFDGDGHPGAAEFLCRQLPWRRED